MEGVWVIEDDLVILLHERAVTGKFPTSDQAIKLETL